MVFRRKRRQPKVEQKPAFTPRQPVPVNKAISKIPVPKGPAPTRPSGNFQAPHHQQESMVELSDDTSPNTPLATTSGGWKLIQPAMTPTQTEAPKEIKITRQEQIWREFKDTLNPKPIYKIGEKFKEINKIKDVQRKLAATVTKQQIKPAPKEIKWELNVLDEKEDIFHDNTTITTKEETPSPVLPKVSDPPKPKVVQGTASEIKLIPKAPAGVTGRKPTNAPKHNEPSQSTVPFPKRDNIEEDFVTQFPNIQNEARAAVAKMFMEGTYPKGVPKSILVAQMEKQIFHELNSAALRPPPIATGPTWNPHMYEEPLQVATEPGSPAEQQYSPSDVYDDTQREQVDDGSESPEAGQKRLSAFRRLGPVSQPKKPKLTINLLCNQEQSLLRREVLEKEVETYTPVHLRKDVIESTNEVVMKYLPHWPWKRNVNSRKSVTVRNSKSVMILEQEQMEEYYEKDTVFLQISVCGYPKHWRKENVLDVILESLKGKTFIPCFIEFTQELCKFLVIRSRSALISIHKLGFLIRKDDVELSIVITQVDLSLNQIDFLPRLVLRKLLAAGYDGERKLSLKEFTLKSDISNFIYFPLSRVTNQSELVQLQSTVAWNYLTDLDLSHNRITSIDGLELPKSTPKLKHLDLSFNWLERVSGLLYSRELSLQSLKLEGNPLCHDYTDPAQYVRVVKMIFPALTEIDGVQIHLKGDLPKIVRNYCPADAAALVGRFLEVFFPLLEAPQEERYRIEQMYDEKAVLTVTYRYGLRYTTLHRKFRNIFLRARVFDEGEIESIEGAAAIIKLLTRWPMVQHDPYTFTVDVIHHSEDSTIIRVDGLLKLTSETLAEDEYLLGFTRTVVLATQDGAEYKILNEMLHWSEPTRELANTAFQYNTIPSSKRPNSLKFDCAPDEETKRKLIEIFMQITESDETASKRCLELKEWHIKNSIEYYMKLVKLDDLSSLRRELEMNNGVK